MRINSNSCALKHLLEQLRDDGESGAQPYKIINKTDYRIVQSILKRVKGQPHGFFKADLSNKEFRWLKKLLFDMYKEQLGDFC